MNNNILEKVTAVFTKILEHDNFELSESTTTHDVDGWESSTHMMIITEIEDEFNIEFELDELWSMKNIGDLVSCIQNKIE
ncbi:acyl carrier protein [Yeosuana marina]|uniref:acyl carrier protein n=1 Tax=Yeosuana marina TaxID=1565536 RepID=UPI0014231A1B|nr:acyl carrier protein [Yeosuana marina]